MTRAAVGVYKKEREVLSKGDKRMVQHSRSGGSMEDKLFTASNCEIKKIQWKMWPLLHFKLEISEALQKIISSTRVIFNRVLKVISRVCDGFAFTMFDHILCDWLTNFTPRSQPIGTKNRANRKMLALVFPHLTP